MLGTGSKRLMIEMPPRHGKSELVSHWTPVWALSLFPEWRVILASYGTEYAEEWGALDRDTINEHEAVLGIKVSRRSEAAGEWRLAGTLGGMVAAGVGKGITGRGANLFIIDDPIKNAEQANSPTYRRKMMRWYRQVARVRLEPDAVIILVQTRWHPEDMAGQLWAESVAGGERWLRITLPALAARDDPLGRGPGEALWPARFDAEALHATRTAIGPYAWAALYQQEPRPHEGTGIWEPEFLRLARIRCRPLDLLRLRGLERVEVAVDPPGSTAECGIVVGARMRHRPDDGPLPRGVLLDDRSLAAPPEVWARAVVEAYEQWQADRIVAEKNHGGDMVRAVIHAVDPSVPITLVTASRAKEVRAEPVATLDRTGRIDWAGQFLRLEEQLVGWVPGEGMESPDRLDAYVWLWTSLLLDGGGDALELHTHLEGERPDRAILNQRW